ncbi:DUF6171 family protein [Paenibacillus endoradicis]|uniref:DUF6171 family protein n=1 Tax=Paenibacillus endoradicis TaxID=2972487 RepID=UPI002158F033|nr:DUF6171 family protein [Paenibacillus endoradicis]MCR8659065.1 DUF6171 family protein [Paenibacillus endoradicis]
MDEEARTDNRCRGCGPQYEVTEQQIDRILLAPMFQDDTIVVSDQEYAQRLSLCDGCDKLMNKQTCLLCGCFIRVSAKYRNKSCPNISDRKWSAIV